MPDLLIIDELGYVPCDSRSADMLHNIISRRRAKQHFTLSPISPLNRRELASK